MLGELTVETLNSFFTILFAPAKYPAMIFTIVPIVLMIVVIEYILMRNPKHESLSNMLYANDLIIIFAGVNLLRAIGNPFMYDFSLPQTMIAYIIVLLGITFIVLDYLKVIPVFIGHSVSTKLVTNYAVYSAIAYVYTGLKFNAQVFLGMIILFFVIVAIINLIKIYDSK